MQVEIQKSILKWVDRQIDRISLKKEHSELLELWLNDIKQPTLSQIKSLSRSTNIPFGYFFLQTPPGENVDLINYRTVKSADNGEPSRNLKATIYAMERVQEWMKNEVILEYGNGPDYVAKLKGYKDVETIAGYIRNAIGIALTWFEKTENKEDAFRLIRRKISESGTMVMQNGVVGTNTRRNLNLQEFRAFAMVDRYAPLIFINNKDSVAGKIFSLFHEFAHICLGSDSLYNMRSDNNISGLEVICNAVAGELCVPKTVFVRYWQNNKEKNLEKKVTKITGLFRCSEYVVARRALDCKYISQEMYQKIIDCQQTKMRNDSGGNYYPTAKSRIDSRFKMLLGNSVLNGRTSYAQAYRLSNTSAKTFSNVVFGESVAK